MLVPSWWRAPRGRYTAWSVRQARKCGVSLIGFQCQQVLCSVEMPNLPALRLGGAGLSHEVLPTAFEAHGNR